MGHFKNSILHSVCANSHKPIGVDLLETQNRQILVVTKGSSRLRYHIDRLTARLLVQLPQLNHSILTASRQNGIPTDE